jgi:hypothetical protein
MLSITDLDREVLASATETPVVTPVMAPPASAPRADDGVTW